MCAVVQKLDGSESARSKLDQKYQRLLQDAEIISAVKVDPKIVGPLINKSLLDESTNKGIPLFVIQENSAKPIVQRQRTSRLNCNPLDTSKDGALEATAEKVRCY